jgi:hypothetical protein
MKIYPIFYENLNGSRTSSGDLSYKVSLNAFNDSQLEIYGRTDRRVLTPRPVIFYYAQQVIQLFQHS